MQGESPFLLEVLGYRDHCSQDYLVSACVVFSCNFIFHKLTSDWGKWKLLKCGNRSTETEV